MHHDHFSLELEAEITEGRRVDKKVQSPKIPKLNKSNVKIDPVSFNSTSMKLTFRVTPELQFKSKPTFPFIPKNPFPFPF